MMHFHWWIVGLSLSSLRPIWRRWVNCSLWWPILWRPLPLSVHSFCEGPQLAWVQAGFPSHCLLSWALYHPEPSSWDATLPIRSRKPALISLGFHQLNLWEPGHAQCRSNGRAFIWVQALPLPLWPCAVWACPSASRWKVSLNCGVRCRIYSAPPPARLRVVWNV